MPFTYLSINGFEKTKLKSPSPKTRDNALNEFAKVLEKSVPKTIKEAVVFPSDGAYWICPNCKIPFSREYQRHCDNCGQKFKWPSLKKIEYINGSEYAKQNKQISIFTKRD